MTSQDYYVISVKRTQRRDLYITVWAPDDKGYRWALSRAGKYSDEHVRAHLGYDIPCPICRPTDAAQWWFEQSSSSFKDFGDGDALCAARALVENIRSARGVFDEFEPPKGDV